MVSKKIMRDFQRCLRNIQSFTDNQAAIIEWDEEFLTRIVVQLRPKEGPYQGGKFDFEICLEDNYPKNAPRVNCLTQIYHPNIDLTCDDYNVCLSLLDEWQEKYGLEDAIQGLLFLLYNPNLEDPLSPMFDPEMSPAEFEENIQKSLEGGEVESETFEANHVEGNGFEADEVSQGIALILDLAEKVTVESDDEDDEPETSDSMENNNAEGGDCNICAEEPQLSATSTDATGSAAGGLPDIVDASDVARTELSQGVFRRLDSKIDRQDNGDRTGDSPDFRQRGIHGYIPRHFETGDVYVDCVVTVVHGFLSR